MTAHGPVRLSIDVLSRFHASAIATTFILSESLLNTPTTRHPAREPTSEATPHHRQRTVIGSTPARLAAPHPLCDCRHTVQQALSHGHESQHQQVHTGGQHGQPEQDEDERHRHVAGLLRERVVFLPRTDDVRCASEVRYMGPTTSRDGGDIRQQ